MGRSGFKTTGIITRNIICSHCDKIFRGAPRMVDKLMDLHLLVAHGVSVNNSTAEIHNLRTNVTSDKNNPSRII